MDGIKEGQAKAAQLINDLQDISLSKIGLIVLGTWIAIALARRVLPYLAEKGPSQLRLYLCAGDGQVLDQRDRPRVRRWAN